MSAIVCAICNQKGGVGKTTTTVNLARLLTSLGKRVLLVDLDEQAAATFHFLGLAGEDLASLQDVIGQKPTVSMAQAITSTSISGLDILPANDDLEVLAADLVNGLSRETRLKKALAQVADEYDYILYDTPPNLSFITINALVSAQKVLIPTQPELFSSRSIDKLLNKIDEIRLELNPSLEVVGILINDYDRDSGVHQSRVPQIREKYAEDPGVLDILVPGWVTIARTTDGNAALYDSNAPAARQASGIYRHIAAAIDPTLDDKELQNS